MARRRRGSKARRDDDGPSKRRRRRLRRRARTGPVQLLLPLQMPFAFPRFSAVAAPLLAASAPFMAAGIEQGVDAIDPAHVAQGVHVVHVVHGVHGVDVDGVHGVEDGEAAPLGEQPGLFDDASG